MDDLTFSYTSFKALTAAGWEEVQRATLTRMERSFCAAADFDSEAAMEGFLHPFIYWPDRIPDAVWFYEKIGAHEIAAAINAAFNALVQQLGPPPPDGYEIFKLIEEQPEWEQKFAEWDEAYGAAPEWANLFEAFLRERGIEPEQFWKS